MPESEYSHFKKIFSSRMVTAVLILILVLALISSGKIIVKRYAIKKQIDELKTEAERLEAENLKFNETLNYLQSDFFKEKEARTKLELQKPGEKVIVIPQQKDEIKKTEALKKQESNWKHWWKYIFK